MSYAVISHCCIGPYAWYLISWQFSNYFAKQINLQEIFCKTNIINLYGCSKNLSFFVEKMGVGIIKLDCLHSVKKTYSHPVMQNRCWLKLCLNPTSANQCELTMFCLFVFCFFAGCFMKLPWSHHWTPWIYS